VYYISHTFLIVFPNVCVTIYEYYYFLELDISLSSPSDSSSFSRGPCVDNTLHIDKLEKENETLERLIEAYKSRVMLVTSFD